MSKSQHQPQMTHQSLKGFLTFLLLLVFIFLTVFAVQADNSRLNDGSIFVQGSQAPIFLDNSQSADYQEGFLTNPSSPQPLSPSDWYVSTQVQNTSRFVAPIEADYGQGCEDLPATHTVSDVADLIYQCQGRLITTLNTGAAASDHAMLYFMPNQLIDLSQDVTVNWDLSTVRTNARHDWLEIWITPLDDLIMSPATKFVRTGQGTPDNGLLLRLDASNNWTILYVENDVVRHFSTRRRPVQTLLTPSKETLSTYELSVSNGRIRFGLPGENWWWLDEALPSEMTGWTAAAIQFGHHSRGVPGSCKRADCVPNSWHWDNFTISSAQSITMIGGGQHLINGAAADQSFTLSSPAPAGSVLRFAGVGNNLKVSFDGGNTWASPQVQGDVKRQNEMKSYTMTVPQGTTEITFKGATSWSGDWAVRDMTVWAGLP